MKPAGKPRPSWLEHENHQHMRPVVEKLPEPHRALLLRMAEHPENKLALLRREQEIDHAERLELEHSLDRTSAEEERMGQLFNMTRLRAARVVEVQKAIAALRDAEKGARR